MSHSRRVWLFLPLIVAACADPPTTAIPNLALADAGVGTLVDADAGAHLTDAIASADAGTELVDIDDDGDSPWFAEPLAGAGSGADPDPGGTLAISADIDVWEQFQGMCREVAKKPSSPKGANLELRVLTAEAQAFDEYRQGAAKAYDQILADRNGGKITNHQLRGQLGAWYQSYKQKYAECGERTKLVTAAAAWSGYQTYEVLRRGGGHEFPIVIASGKIYLIEAWPGNDANLFLEVTLERAGKPAAIPANDGDWADIDFKAGGKIVEKSGGVNKVLPAEK